MPLIVMTPAEKDRLDADALHLLAAYEKGEHSELIAEVQRMVRQGPVSASVWGVAAAGLIALGLPKDAARAARNALALEPRRAWLHGLRSQAEAGQGNWEAAVEAAGLAVQLEPDEPGYLVQLSACLREAGRAAEAAAAARRALRLAPDHAQALIALGLAMEATGDTDGALAAYRRAQSAAPAEPEACLHEASLLRRSGCEEQAQRALLEALRRRPGLAAAEDGLARGLSGSGIVQAAALHALTLSRLSGAGWAIFAFLYYLLYRLLEFLWRKIPDLLPAGRFLLIAILVWALAGAAAGWLLRLLFRARSAEHPGTERHQPHEEG